MAAFHILSLKLIYVGWLASSVSGNGKVAFQLYSFENPSGKLSDGSTYCYHNLFGEKTAGCNYYFEICFSRVFNPYKSGSWGCDLLYAKSGTIFDKDSVYLSDVAQVLSVQSFATTSGPVVNGYYLRISVWNYNRYMPNTFVAYFSTLIEQVKSDGSSTVFEMLNGASTVIYAMRATCSANYYGSDCTTYCCIDSNDRHICDTNGNKVCMAGWTGPTCSTLITSTSTSTSTTSTTSTFTSTSPSTSTSMSSSTTSTATSTFTSSFTSRSTSSAFSSTSIPKIVASTSTAMGSALKPNLSIAVLADANAVNGTVDFAAPSNTKLVIASTSASASAIVFVLLAAAAVYYFLKYRAARAANLSFLRRLAPGKHAPATQASENVYDSIDIPNSTVACNAAFDASAKENCFQDKFSAMPSDQATMKRQQENEDNFYCGSIANCTFEDDSSQCNEEYPELDFHKTSC